MIEDCCDEPTVTAYFVCNRRSLLRRKHSKLHCYKPNYVGTKCKIPIVITVNRMVGTCVNYGLVPCPKLERI